MAMLQNQEPAKKRSKLVLPEPQISDQVTYTELQIQYLLISPVFFFKYIHPDLNHVPKIRGLRTEEHENYIKVMCLNQC